MEMKPPTRRLYLTSTAIASLLLTGIHIPGHAQHLDDADLIRLLEQGNCKKCKLSNADLVHADLRNANLQGAQLQGANLSQAKLDGADLRGSDLSFANLSGASLRGARLESSNLLGADLRHSDLTGASIEPQSLRTSHWQEAYGAPYAILSYQELHNNGIRATKAGRLPEAESFFSLAIQRQPDAAISWVARGLNRLDLGQLEAAARDLKQASKIYSLMGDQLQANSLEQASKTLAEQPKTPRRSNGIGSAIISGTAAAIKALTPLAIKAITPAPF